MVADERQELERRLLEAQVDLERALDALRAATRDWWDAPASKLVQARYAITTAEARVALANDKVGEMARALHQETAPKLAAEARGAFPFPPPRAPDAYARVHEPAER